MELSEQLRSYLPTSPAGSEYYAEAAGFSNYVLPHWRSRRAERGIQMLPADLSSFGKSDPNVQRAAPGRAWGWKAFRPDPSGPDMDALVVKAFVRRCVVTASGQGAEARLAGLPLGFSEEAPPLPRFRVVISIMAPGLAGGLSLPAGTPEYPQEVALFASDATSAQPSMVITEASRTVMATGDAEGLPDVPPNVNGLGCVTWYEALSVSAPVAGSAGRSPPPVVLRVQVISEVALVGAEGEDMDGSGGGNLAAVSSLAASIDLGVAGPGNDAPQSCGDPQHYRLRYLDRLCRLK